MLNTIHKQDIQNSKTPQFANPEEIAAEGVIDWALSLDMWHMEDICEYMTAYIAQPDQRILKEYFRGTFMAIVIMRIVDIEGGL